MRRILTAALMVSGLALAACGPVNRGVDSVNQPVVQRTDYLFDASKMGLSDGPASAEANRLDAWLSAINVAYGDRVSVDDPSPYDRGDAREVIAAVVGRRGLLLSEASPVTSGELPAGIVRVIVSRSTASVPNCPNWDRPSAPELANSTMSNYGCSVASNFAAMVANPEDLIEGRASMEGADPRTATKAISQYRAQTNAQAGSGQLPTGNTRTGGN